MKKLLTTTILVGALFVPLFASAQNSIAITTAVGTSTASQIFTACSQVSIEKRDTSMSEARVIYNTAINDALTSRKEAEVKLVGTEDVTEKKVIAKTSLEAYKTSVKAAQDALIQARSDAWTSFGDDMKTCSDMQKGIRSKAAVEEKKNEAKAATALRKAEVQTMPVELKATVTQNQKQVEPKTFGENLKEQIGAFFGFFKGKVSSTVIIEEDSANSR